MWGTLGSSGVLGELSLRESGSTRVSALGDMGVDWVSVTRCCRGGIVGEVVEVDHGFPSDHIGQLRCDVFCGSSIEVLGFLVQLEIVCWVIGWWWLKCDWEWFGHASGCGTIGVGVGIGVLEGSMGVGVGLAMRCCVGGADADLVGRSTGMMSIGAGSVSGYASCGRVLELK